jgi:hypothetical protein
MSPLRPDPVAEDRREWGHVVMARTSSLRGFSPWCGLCGRTVQRVPGTQYSWVHLGVPPKPKEAAKP